MHKITGSQSGSQLWCVTYFFQGKQDKQRIVGRTRNTMEEGDSKNEQESEDEGPKEDEGQENEDEIEEEELN